MRIPISGFEQKEDGSRPSVVTEEAWIAANEETQARVGGDSVLFSTSQFTGADKLAEAGSLGAPPLGRKSRKSPMRWMGKERLRAGEAGAASRKRPLRSRQSASRAAVPPPFPLMARHRTEMRRPIVLAAMVTRNALLSRRERGRGRAAAMPRNRGQRGRISGALLREKRAS